MATIQGPTDFQEPKSENESNDEASSSSLSSRQRLVLTRDKARDIFRLKFTHGCPSLHAASVQLARDYKVSSKAIRDIWKGRSWLEATFDLWSDEDRPERRIIGRPKGKKDSKQRIRSSTQKKSMTCGEKNYLGALSYMQNESAQMNATGNSQKPDRLPSIGSMLQSLATTFDFTGSGFSELSGGALLRQPAAFTAKPASHLPPPTDSQFPFLAAYPPQATFPSNPSADFHTFGSIPRKSSSVSNGEVLHFAHVR